MTNPWTLLGEIQAKTLLILGDALRGFYAHGSLAFGCFQPETSDIDFLIVTSRAPLREEKRALIECMLSATPFAPKKGLEMSVVLEADCRKIKYPVPYCLHFSNMHIARARADMDEYIESMQGEDPDLTAHFAVTREVGVALYGPPANQMFTAVKKRHYIQSILYDVGNATRDILSDPVYYTLNLCRALAFAREGKILSKDEGGAWATDNLPVERARFAEEALIAHQSHAPFTPDDKQARAFARAMLDDIEECAL